uniref:Ubiquitin-conjugating enzyme E2 Q2 n=1 Tax=Aceria tosichella TaxID=561515 RepID=A0A6G1S8J6_9ACAR
MSSVARILMILAVTAIVIQQVANAQDDNKYGSTRASKRLMKELQRFYESDSFKNGVFSVELVDDNIYEMEVKVLIIDADSPLYIGLQKLKEHGGKDHLKLRVSYKDDYPISPPSVRVVYPIFQTPPVSPTGFICMELLSPQGWSSAYTLEPLLIQIAATLSQVRVDPSADIEQYSPSEEDKLNYTKFLERHPGW